MKRMLLGFGFGLFLWNVPFYVAYRSHLLCPTNPEFRGGAVNAKIKVKLLGKCPCGRNIGASTDPALVVHEMPYCEKFEELEPDEFLTYVRKSRGDAEVEA